MEQQTERIYQYMTLLALDLFVRIIAMRIDAGPPFSALFTLWPRPQASSVCAATLMMTPIAIARLLRR
jgi:hypothetical protein